MNTIIETSRLLIRPPTYTDVRALTSILSDPVTMAFWPSPLTTQDVRKWIDDALRSHAEHGFGRCAVILKQTGELIGDCGIMRGKVAGMDVDDLGWILHEPRWHHGYATEATLAIARHAFEVLGLDALHANMPHDHHASRRVAERIGMRFLGQFLNERNRQILTLLYVAERPRPAAAGSR